MIDAVDQALGAADDPAERVGMASKKFGRAVNDKVGAEFQRSLIDGRGKSTVDRNQRSMTMRCGGEARDIDNLDGRIRRRLKVKQLAALRDCSLDRIVIGGIAQRDIHLKPRQKFDEEFIRPAVRVVNGNDAVSGREQRKQGIADGRHAAGETGRRFRAFEFSGLIFKRRNGGISVASVDVARTASKRDFEPVFYRLVAKRNTQRDGNLCRIDPALTLFSRPDCLRSESRTNFVF